MSEYVKAAQWWAFKKGQRAWWDGADLVKDNPYSSDSSYFKDWVKGWNEHGDTTPEEENDNA